MCFWTDGIKPASPFPSLPLVCVSAVQTWLNFGVSLVAQTVKNLSAMQEDLDSLPGLEGSPGEENENPFQYSCLEKSMDRGAW